MIVAATNSRWILARAFAAAVDRERVRLGATPDSEAKAIEHAYQYVSGEFFLKTYSVETFHLAAVWASRMMRDVEDGDKLALDVAWEVTAAMLATRHGLDDGRGLPESRRFWRLVCEHVIRVRNRRGDAERN